MSVVMRESALLKIYYRKLFPSETEMSEHLRGFLRELS